MSTKRVKLTVAYDGTDFCGWAAQAGRRTVQGTLTETVRQVSDEDCEIIGASRTDSGAHAKGQVCHFDTIRPIVPRNWVKALNDRLPVDLKVVKAQWVSPAFHSRFCADDRFYRYRISTSPADPFRARYAHEHGRALDLEPMREAAALLVGLHDFRAFTEELHPWVENTMRRLRSVEVRKTSSEVCIDIVGTAFLRGMMRRISGALYEIGRHRREVSTIPALLGPEGPKLHLPVVLPAKGLTLMSVRYSHPLIDKRVEDAPDED